MEKANTDSITKSIRERKKDSVTPKEDTEKRTSPYLQEQECLKQ